jgi:6-pyruvoyltetrahydropterin/6-carboxytetrahydropterin synthase
VYDISVSVEISAGHFLRGYHGKCENCHGHNWKIELCVRTETLDPQGLGIDFGALKDLLTDVTAPYDHVMLNELPEFSEENPTSENLARHIYRTCQQRLAQGGSPVRVLTVTVWESRRACVIYHE